jgi:hypothetical protein
MPMLGLGLYQVSPGTAEDMTLLDGLNENLHLCWDPTNAP